MFAQRKKNGICVTQDEIILWETTFTEVKEALKKLRKGQPFPKDAPLNFWIESLEGIQTSVWNAWDSDPKVGQPEPVNWQECRAVSVRASVALKELEKRRGFAVLNCQLTEMSPEEFMDKVQSYDFIFPSDMLAMQDFKDDEFQRRKVLDLCEYVLRPDQGLVRAILDGIRTMSELTEALGMRWHYTAVKPTEFVMGVGQSVVSLVPSSCSEKQRTTFLEWRARNPGQKRIYGSHLKSYVAKVHAAAVVHLVTEYGMAVRHLGFSCVKIDPLSPIYGSIVAEACLGLIGTCTTSSLVHLYQVRESGEKIAAFGLSSFPFIPP